MKIQILFILVLQAHEIDSSKPDFPFVSKQKYNPFEEVKQTIPKSISPNAPIRATNSLTIIDYHGKHKAQLTWIN